MGRLLPSQLAHMGLPAAKSAYTQDVSTAKPACIPEAPNNSNPDYYACRCMHDMCFFSTRASAGM